MRARVQAAALALALAAGVALFPRAAEPGRAEADVVRLDLLRDGRLAPDWYPATAEVRVAGGSRGAVLTADPATAVQLASRTVAVRPGSCYRLVVGGAARTGAPEVVVTDEELAIPLARVAIAAGPAERRAAAFATEGRRRVSVIFLAAGPAVAVVDTLRLERTERGACATGAR